MRQNQCIVLFIISSVLWVALLNYFIVRSSNLNYEQRKLNEDLKEFEVRVEEQFSDNILHDELKAVIREIVDKTNSVKHNNESKKEEAATTKTAEVLEAAAAAEEEEEKIDGEAKEVKIVSNADAIAILVFSCNRVALARCLDRLIKFRPSKERFPIIVSQDCVHESTSNVIKSYGDQLYHIRQPDQSDIHVPPKEKKFKGYFKIARHYKWALNRTFNHYHFETVVVIEDDLDVSSDFYDYFASALPVLRADKSLWCVSAWNDNGKLDLVDRNAADLLYRTDFFPGLGWMLTKSLWRELVVKWPKSYWDDWMRRPEQRKNRSCIRPELSRTRTFGKIGVSNGMFYDKHLKYIFLNEKPVDFTRKNLSYLLKETYDPSFLGVVYGSPIVSIQELQTDRVFAKGPVRVLYDGKLSLRKITKAFGLMDDFRSGVPRTGYLGVISFVYNKRRVFITPSSSWSAYDPTW